jgi:hypothetical protein
MWQWVVGIGLGGELSGKGEKNLWHLRESSLPVLAASSVTIL